VSDYHGRLELTWTNKDLRLLAQEDGSYEWVPPSDYRVAEVRLLHNVDTVGDVADDSNRATDNLLIQGDALNALTSLVHLPEFEREYVGKVKLAYIDPPFNTQQSFMHYDDALEHSVWLTMMRDRLVQIKTLLAPDGSVWVHCDDSEQAYLKVLMDEVFGRDNFVSTFVWQGRYSRSNDALVSVSHNYIMVFAKEKQRLSWNRLLSGDEQEQRYSNPDNDARGAWTSVSFNAPNIRPNLTYEIVAPNGKKHWPPKGRCWSTGKTEYDSLFADGRIWFGADGNGVPRIKRFWNENPPTLTPWTWWPHDEVGHTQESMREIQALFPGQEAFSTPKPERLMQRIIHIATNVGDVVLDCFLGSATTAAVAHKMGRRWVGSEISENTVASYGRPRLTKVVEGNDDGGISKVVSWEGGGGFRILAVAPSMFTEDGGQVFLSEWATNGQLAEVTAAQLHYDYAYEPPFCGRRGRSRLAVIDGLVNESVVRLLVNALSEDERVVVCGTAIDVAARDVLRTLRPGSSVRKIPQSILQDYQQTTRKGQYSRIDASPISVDSPVLESHSSMSDTPQQTIAP